jgi:phage terminase Nu1 subunit (DNA packaging protein)
VGARVTQSELARLLGVQRSYIHKLKTQGVLLFDSLGLIDEDVARQSIEQNHDPGKRYMKDVNQRQRDDRAAETKPLPPDDAEPRAPSNNLSYMRAKTMREAFNAKIAELEYKERKGELRDSQSVRKAITDSAVVIRSALELIPDKLSIRMAAESDPEKCHTLLTSEIDQTLAELTALCDRMVEGKV